MKHQETTDFWTRRKAAVALESAQEAERTQRAELDAESEALDQSSDERSEAEILRQLDLPDPDSLRQGDDFSVFMKSAVPETIRRRALRKLWLSNPVLANLDELVDYGEDFTDAATVVDNLQTAYQVGRGMLRHVMEGDEAETKTETETLPDENPGDEREDNVPVAAKAEPEVETPTESRHGSLHNGGDSPNMQAESETVDVPNGHSVPLPRRMRFRVTA